MSTLSADETEARAAIRSMLEHGLKTEVFPRADTHERVLEVTTRLRIVPGDLRTKLIIAGFTPQPIESEEIVQSCETCMYFLVHRRFCELPELALPVDPEWSCRLWRI